MGASGKPIRLWESGRALQTSGYKRAANDWYVEPSWIVTALLDRETFEGRSWDPACGGGTIPRTMIARGLHCIGSDLMSRGYGDQRNFMCMSTDLRVENIVSNPPYGIIEPWIDKCLAQATNKVAIFARLALLEGIRRRDWFKQVPLARVWISSRRVSCPPGGTDIQAAGGKTAYAWFVFEHGHEGPPTIGWI